MLCGYCNMAVRKEAEAFYFLFLMETSICLQHCGLTEAVKQALKGLIRQEVLLGPGSVLSSFLITPLNRLYLNSASFHFYPLPSLSLHLPLHTSPSSIWLPSPPPTTSTPPASSSFSSSASLLSHWHHTLLPSPENHFKQPAPSKPTVSQPGSQFSQPASQPFCFDLKLLSSQSQGCFPLLIHIKDPLKLPKFPF